MGLALVEGGQFSHRERWLIDGKAYAYDVIASAVDMFGAPDRNVPAKRGYAYVEFDLKPGQLTIGIEPVDDLLADSAVTIVFSSDVPSEVVDLWMAETYETIEGRSGLVVRDDAAV